MSVRWGWNSRIRLNSKDNSEIIWELKIKAMFGSGKFEEKCKEKIDLKLIIIFIYYFKLILVILILLYKN